ncbi:MAG TPA: hypothetical protein VN976_21905 [Verrucomicrobiae bacterium]|nr:hypothetical protein [Verrucomicrobiae bacterium]
MGAGGFLGGLFSGYAGEAKDRQKAGKRGLLRRKKKAPVADPIEYKKGGRVKRGGWAKVHKGEVVVPKRGKKRGKKSGKRR